MQLSACSQPWFEMQIEYSDRVGCCCYYWFGKDPLTIPFDGDTCWIRSKMKEIRQTIASNNADGTGCDGCQYIKYASASDLTTIPESLNKLQQDS